MIDIDKIVAEVSPYYAKRKKKKDKGVNIGIASSEHKLVYDSSAESLEPIYFWILDFMNNMFGGKVEKIVDNFAASPGSGHFSDLGMKKTQMQKQSQENMQIVNTILRSVMNILYDLKEFQIRLSHYDNAKSEDKGKKQAGILALKQVWMDKVDIQRGAGSINAMSAGNLKFVTLRDSFMVADTPDDVDKLDLNDIVKRVLKPRIQEFLEWKKRSEQQLKRQFELEKTYLKSQVDSLKLYAKWAKPYLKAAQQLEASEELGKKPGYVNVFSTVLFELALMAGRSVNIKSEAIEEKNLPRDFAKMKNLREYNSIVVVDFNFRGIPSKFQVGERLQGVFGGRAEVIFKSYALNADELALLKDKLSDSDLEDSLKLVQGMTDDSLAQLKLDINEFLEDVEEQEKPELEDINPFTALFSFGKKEKKETKEEQEEKLKKLREKGVKKDSYAENYIRNLAEANAINSCFTVFDIYKKAHQMAAFPYAESAEGKAPRTAGEKLFGLSKPK